MARLSSATHLLAGSVDMLDDASATNPLSDGEPSPLQYYAFKVQGATSIGGKDRTVTNDTDESGRPGLLGYGTDTTIVQEYNKTIQIKGDNASCGFWSYWASHGGAAAVSAVTATTGAGARYYWNGGGENSARVVNVGDFADKDSNNGTLNRAFPCVVNRVTISGRRGEQIQVEVELLGSGAAASVTGAAPTSSATIVERRDAIYTFHKDFILNESDDIGFAYTDANGHGASGTAFMETARATIRAARATYSALSTGGSGVNNVDYLPYCEAFSITWTNGNNKQRSLAARGQNYVVLDEDWFVDSRGAQIDLEFVSDSTNIHALIAEHEAGTARGWEIGLLGAEIDATTNDTHAHCIWSFGNCIPIPTGEPESGGSVDETKTVNLSWRAGSKTASDPTGWLCGFADNRAATGSLTGAELGS